MRSGQEANSETAPGDSPAQGFDWDADQWIQWVAGNRRSNPAMKLSDLLPVDASSRAKISPELLLDLVCIDLIEQIRMSNQVSVESYLDQFKELRQRQTALDLIDAEICARREVGQLGDRKSELASYCQRFPTLADEIESLLDLKSESPIPGSPAGPSPQVLASSSHLPEEALKTCDTPQADDFSFDLFPAANSAAPATGAAVPLNSALSSPPIDAPEWFLGEQCISSGDGHWLLRGRDSNTGETMAMKVIRLPSQTLPADIEQLLQSCESASRVRSPAWTAPVVAAAQNNYLALIRPWIFGTHWQVASQNAEVPGRLRLLSQVAYALQSAHNSQAWHGGLHEKNVIIDHQGSVHLVDAVGASSGLRRWLGVIGNSKSTTRAPNWSVDAHSLVKLILQDDIDVPGRWSTGLRDVLDRLVANQQNECFAQIGDELMSRADSFLLDEQHSDAGNLSSNKRWRKKIARWIGGQ
jgi:hypothetical protein